MLPTYLPWCGVVLHDTGSRTAIIDWRIYPRPGGSDLPPTPGRRRHWSGRAQSAYLSVSCGRLALLINLEWMFLTADDNSKASATDVIRCVGHFSSFTHSVSRPLMKYIRIGWGQKIGISVWAENDVLSLTLDYQLPELIPTNSNSGLHSWMLSR